MPGPKTTTSRSRRRQKRRSQLRLSTSSSCAFMIVTTTWARPRRWCGGSERVFRPGYCRGSGGLEVFPRRKVAIEHGFELLYLRPEELIEAFYDLYRDLREGRPAPEHELAQG